MSTKEWNIYRGDGQKPKSPIKFPDPPPWRDPKKRGLRGSSYEPGPDEIRAVNAAIHLRRPLLVTGRPGTGKSTLAHAVAHELGLDEVLYWPITTKSTLKEGLYSYDAIGRLQAKGLGGNTTPDVSEFMRLGALGTALHSRKPRVVLIDEIDKSDVDLPNDLLTVLEEGSFIIDELARLKSSDSFKIPTHNSGPPVPVRNGKVGNPKALPIVIFTSNGEREFPAPFLRRCIRVRVDSPDEKRLKDIVTAHLDYVDDARKELITDYLKRLSTSEIATDQLLNTIYLLAGETEVPEAEKTELKELLLKKLVGSDAQ